MNDDFPIDDALRSGMAERMNTFERLAQEGDGLKHAAVTMTVIDDGKGHGAFILTKRAPRMNKHAGQWALPGGRLKIWHGKKCKKNNAPSNQNYYLFVK